MENSRLNKLPAELRLNIYELALTIPEGISLEIIYDHQGEPSGLEVVSKDARETLQLLNTCKQIRNEALPVFFSSNRFVIETRMMTDFDEADSDMRKDEALEGTKGWLASMSPWLPFIRNVAICSEEWYSHAVDDDYVASWLPRSLNEFRALITNPRTQLAWSLPIRLSRFCSYQERVETSVFHGDIKRTRASFERAFRDPESMIAHGLEPAGAKKHDRSQEKREEFSLRET